MGINNNLSSTSRLTRTATLPASGVITVCGWSQVTSPTSGAGFHALFFMEDASEDFGINFNNSTGAFIIDTSGAVPTAFGTSPTAGQWFFWALTHAGAGANNLKGYWALPGDTTFQTAQMAGKTVTPTSMWLLGNPYSQPYDGSLDTVKMWTAVLSADELMNEMRSMFPLRYANLYDYWPLWSTSDPNAYHGGHDWTVTGAGLTTVATSPWSGFNFDDGAAPHAASSFSPGAGASDLVVAGAATSAALKASAGANDLVIAGAATSNALKASAGANDVVFSGAATSNALKASAASAAVAFTIDATSQGASAGAPSAALTIAGAATGAALFAGAPSAALTVAGNVRGVTKHEDFPLAAHASGKYCTTPAGTPFLFRGNSAWAMFNELTLADVRLVLDDFAADGYNALKAQVSIPDEFWSGGSSPGALGAGGAKPFNNWDGVWGDHDAEFDQPNDTYWDWVDTVISEASARGIVLIVDHMYPGFNLGATGGWYQDVISAHNTQTICYNLGLYIGARWKWHANLILNFCTDTFPSATAEGAARYRKFIEGMIDAGCTQLITAQGPRSSDSSDFDGVIGPDYDDLITFRSVYPGRGAGATMGATYARALVAYATSPQQPMATVEMVYEGEDSKTREQLRSHAWWAACAGAMPFIGVRNLELFIDDGSDDWRDFLDTDLNHDAKRLGDFFASLNAWYDLVPDGLGGIGTLVTAGGGGTQTASTPGMPNSPDNTSGLDHVMASMTPGGTILVAYEPHSHTGSFTIDMSLMIGASSIARWFDPTDGSYQNATGSPIANSGTHAFTNPGNNSAGVTDWVLLLEAQTSGAPSAALVVAGAATSNALKEGTPSAALVVAGAATGASLFAAAPSGVLDIAGAATSAALKAAAAAADLVINGQARAPGGTSSNFFFAGAA